MVKSLALYSESTPCLFFYRPQRAIPSKKQPRNYLYNFINNKAYLNIASNYRCQFHKVSYKMTSSHYGLYENEADNFIINLNLSENMRRQMSPVSFQIKKQICGNYVTL